MSYAIRLQNYPTYDEKVQTIFSSDRFNRTIRVHHTGRKKDNPHWHLLVECDYKKPALRAELKKHFTLATGNKHISIKDWDGNIKATAYLFHEGTEPDLIRNFTQEEIDNARQMNTQVQATIKSNAPVKIIQDAVDYFTEQGNYTPHQKHIFDFVYDRLRSSGDWLPNKFQFERWAVRIQATLRPDKEWREYKTELYESWYGQCAYRYS